MARLPGVYPDIQDGGLGVLAASSDGLRAVVGVSSAGEFNTPLAFSDPAQVEDKLGTGPLATAVADQLSQGGGIVYGCRANAGVAGVVTPNADNPAAPTLVVSGSPLDAYALIVTITKGGALGTSAFTYSLDGGDTVSLAIATAANYVIPGTGLTLEFDAVEAYTQGQVYTFAVSAPEASVAEAQEAIRALFDSSLLYEYIHLAQPADNAMWAALDALAVEAENDFRYIFFLAETEAPGDDVDAWVNTLLSQKETFSSRHVQIVPAFAEVVDTLNGRLRVANQASRIGARMSRSKVSENPGWVQRGPLSGAVVAAPFTSTTFGKKSTYNNGHALTLDSAGFTTIYQLAGRSGWFVVDGRMAAEATSDYKTVMNRRVMNKAATLVRQAILDFVQQGIDPVDLQASLAGLVARAGAPLRVMAGDGELVRGRVVIPPGQDVLATSKLTAVVKIVPLGYLREIDLPIGFENPFLAATA